MDLENNVTEETVVSDSEYDAQSDESMDNNFNKSDEGISKNLAWANAMSKVLKTNVSKKNFILSKAQKDKNVIKRKQNEIELVDEHGKVISKTEIDPKLETEVFKQKRKKKVEKQREKARWESMCRVKPDVTQKERERELIKIATRGVVHLFNTVEKHQKAKNPKEKGDQKKESLGKIKGNFMDILKGFSRSHPQSEPDPEAKKAKEETWNILKDDFMMGAEMKDWDKESVTD